MLRLRVALGEGESAESFCSRLASRNGRPDVRDFCADQGILFKDVVDGRSAALTELAELGGPDPAILVGQTIRRINNTKRFEYRGSELSRPTMLLNQIYVCPECLTEDLKRTPDLGQLAAFARTEWLLSPIRTCPDHRKSLVAINVGRPITRADDYAGLIRDRLHELAAWTADSQFRESSCLENYIRNRLDAARSTPIKSGWLDDFPFYAAVRLCEVVGAVAILGAGVKFNQLADDQWWQACKEGFGILADGPTGVGILFDHLAEDFWHRKGDAGSKAWLGRFHEWLSQEVGQDEAYEPIRRIIREHLVETLPLGPGDKLLGQPITERRLWSVHTAAKETGTHPKRLRKLLAEAEFLPAETGDLSDSRATFPADQAAAAFLGRVTGAMSVQKARAYINAPRIQFSMLLEAGIVRPFIRGGSDILKDHAVARYDLDDFLSRLLVDATDATDADGDLVDIQTCPGVARCPVTAVVNLILERRLSRVRRRPGIKGYLSVLVDPKEVRELMHRKVVDDLTLKEVERLTHWSDVAIRGLLDFGCLPSVTVQNPLSHLYQRVVKRADFISFTARYVSLLGLARERGEHFRAVKKWLERNGVQPSFPPDQVSVTMYCRDHVPTEGEHLLVSDDNVKVGR